MKNLSQKVQFNLVQMAWPAYYTRDLSVRLLSIFCRLNLLLFLLWIFFGHGLLFLGYICSSEFDKV